MIMAYGPVSIGGYFALAPASDTQLGGIKISDDFVIDSNGVLKLKREQYPVGSIFLSTSDIEPAELFGGTWEKIAEERTLMGASDIHPVNTTVEAGLPNITGTLRARSINADTSTFLATTDVTNNAFVSHNNTTWTGNHYCINGAFTSPAYYDDSSFMASGSNTIYGASDTVQPPSYYVYIWMRIK